MEAEPGFVAASQLTIRYVALVCGSGGGCRMGKRNTGLQTMIVFNSHITRLTHKWLTCPGLLEGRCSARRENFAPQKLFFLIFLLNEERPSVCHEQFVH